MTATPKPGKFSKEDVAAAPEAQTPTEDDLLLGGQGPRLDQAPGWDPERRVLVHQDPGKRALELVNKAAAKRCAASKH